MADIMRVQTGLHANLTVLQHRALCEHLFRPSSNFKLPARVVPLCNSSAKDSVITVMPSCDAHGIEVLWQEPPEDAVQGWFDTLVERPVREEKDLFRDTTLEELDHIANRAVEARMAGDVSGSGSAATNVDEESCDGMARETPEELAEEQEEPAGERGGDTIAEQVSEEPPAPSAPARRIHVLQKAASGEPVHGVPLGEEFTGEEVTGKVARRQGTRRQTHQQQ
jgi:hypothetical protein